jgi:hypothetical protein
VRCRDWKQWSDKLFAGTNVTESSGNTATQSAAFPFSDLFEAVNITRLVRVIQHQIDYRVSTTHMVSNTDPTGYNVGYLAGYGDARTLIKENKEFIKAEIIAYITENYPAVKYSRTICKRDTGFIVDAMIYDLTYGGQH